MSIPDDVIEQVRDAADVVELIGESVDLRRTGTDYRGPCPFHGGAKRNFAVIPKKQMFYCFVCHEGGDVFTYYMKTMGLDYPHAVREVAQKIGITIPERSTGGPDPRDPLYGAVSVAADWFAHRLREGSDAASARDYLASRGFDLGNLPQGLGFSPKGPEFLKAMETLGVSEDVLLRSGLAVKRDDESARPRFWGRLLFPIHDVAGRVVGFGGRVIGEGEPKYLNSPDSEIFHKGRLLYNLHSAKHAIRRVGRAIAVEGYTDVLRAVEAGVENVVACLGTAFTTEQATLLKRYTQETVLLYDNDAPGMRASFRAADELLRVSMRTFIATPPPGEDPDSLVANGGAEALQTVIDDAIDVFERKLQLIERKGWLENVAGRRRALDRLLPTLRAAKDPVMQDLYVGRASEDLGIGIESIRRELAETRDRPQRPPSPSVAPAQNAPWRLRPERYLVQVMVHEPQWRERVAERLSSSPDDLAEPERELLARLGALPADMPASEVLQRVTSPARALLADVLNEPWGKKMDVDATVSGALNKIESRRVEAELNDRKRRLPLMADEDKEAAVDEIRALRKKRNDLNPARWPVIR